MSSTYVPLISSGVAGPLGVLHLPRLWLKASLEACGKIAPGYPGCGKGYDQMVLDGLGISRDTFLAFIKNSRPTYPQVESCVQRRLKADPTFQGGWKVKFTIETDGTVSGFGSTALENPDPELESCMQRTITAWRFQRIARPFKVGKTYRFAAGW